MMQKRVLAVYFSMIRRRAICAVAVMASASSRMISLKAPSDEPEVDDGARENICFVPGRAMLVFNGPDDVSINTSERFH